MKYTIKVDESLLPDRCEPIAFDHVSEGDMYTTSGKNVLVWKKPTLSSWPYLHVRKKPPGFKVGDWVQISTESELSKNWPTGPHRVVDVEGDQLDLTIGGLFHISHFEHCDPPKPTPPTWLKRGELLTKSSDSVMHWKHKSIHPEFKCGYWTGYPPYQNITGYVERGAIEIPPEFEYLPWEMCIVEGESE